MSSIADEILSYFGISDREDDYLEHYGTPRHSGRYPYGSGENPYQHSGDFLGRISELKKAGFTYTDDDGKVWTGDNAIAKSMGLTSTEYRRQVSWADMKDVSIRFREQNHSKRMDLVPQRLENRWDYLNRP